VAGVVRVTVLALKAVLGFRKVTVLAVMLQIAHISMSVMAVLATRIAGSGILLHLIVSILQPAVTIAIRVGETRVEETGAGI
jgi:hypothetical protein